MPQSARYINPRTNATWPDDTALWRAPDDGGYVNLTSGKGLAPGDIDATQPSLWRYGAALRVAPPRVSLGEGWTPLVPGRWGEMSLFWKLDFLMPSGSFKDRGTAVMLAYLDRAGVTQIIEDSSGNAGASVATYGGALGMDCRILVPASAPAPKKIQIAAMGVTLEPVEGDRQAVADAALAAAETAFYASHNRQPYFLEGTKTVAFEIWEQLGFRAPDAVVAPLGQGSNIMGAHLGFAELLAAGQIDRLPRIYAVQAANAAPYQAAIDAGSDRPVPIQAKPTIADGIAASQPVRLKEVLDALTESGGRCVAVSEDEIAAALHRFCSMGLFVEPTTAAVGAGLTRFLADGHLRADETVAVILTGSGLKAVEKIGAALGLG
ncbi:MAG: threonine synthase [Alphaproteobacteria bacterium]